jgi:putative membrane protein
MKYARYTINRVTERRSWGDKPALEDTIGKARRFGMMHWGTYGWGMGIGWIWMVLVWVIILTGIAYVVRKASCRPANHESPLDLLKKRYARGELTKDEFDRMRNDISKR